MTEFYIERVDDGVPVLAIIKRGVPGEAGDKALIQGRLDALYGVYRPWIVSIAGVTDEANSFPLGVYDQGHSEGLDALEASSSEPSPVAANTWSCPDGTVCKKSQACKCSGCHAHGCGVGGSCKCLDLTQPPNPGSTSASSILPFDVRMALARLSSRASRAGLRAGDIVQTNPRQGPPIICSDGTRVNSITQCPPVIATERGLPTAQLGYQAVTTALTCPPGSFPCPDGRCVTNAGDCGYTVPTDPTPAPIVVPGLLRARSVPERQRNTAGLRFLIDEAEAREPIQSDIDVAADARPPSVATPCFFIGEACCKMTSTGLWRCSWPDLPGQPGTRGACTPGVETCPRWLLDAIGAAALEATMPPVALARGVPAPRGVRRLRSQLRRQALLAQSRLRAGLL